MSEENQVETVENELLDLDLESGVFEIPIADAKDIMAAMGYAEETANTRKLTKRIRNTTQVPKRREDYTDRQWDILEKVEAAKKAGIVVKVVGPNTAKDTNKQEEITETREPLPVEEIGKPATAFKSRDVILTAKDAEDLLLRNKSNRPLSSAKMRQYKEAMKSGAWRFDSPIQVIIDTNGDLQNGQKVLTAQVLASQELGEDLEISAVITTGTLPETSDLIDTGQSRSHADVLYRKKLFGEVSAAAGKRLSRILGSAMKIFHLRSMGMKPRSTKRYSHEQMLETVANHPEFVESAKFIDEIERHSKKGLSSKAPLSYFAAAHYLARNSRDVEKVGTLADEWIQGIATGEGLEADSPVFVLREWLTRQDKDKTREQMNRFYDALVLGWNAFVENGKLRNNHLNRIQAEKFYIMGGLDSYVEDEDGEQG